MSAFPAVRIEGGLFAPDLLDQILAGELPGQRQRDFGLGQRRGLTDEIAAAFADARNLWNIFQHRLERLNEADIGTSVTRDAWVIPFLGIVGYELQYNRRAYNVGGMTFAISHRAGESEGAPPVHIVGVRQELGRVAAGGRPRLAPHSLVQEFLNRTESLWGLVTNGKTLRLLRNSSFIRRQCYLELDLEAIIEQRLFQDFAILYRLLHRSRLPDDAAEAHRCFLEQYYQHSVEQGGRVRDHLRDGVEECIKRLANGFLAHPANEELRRRLAPGYADPDRISPNDLYRQLLRLVYRFLFLLVAEDRGLVSDAPLYREHYSVSRLRRLAERRQAYTDHEDLWLSLRVLWKLLSDDAPQQQLGGEPLAAALGLPVLNGELFEAIDLDDCALVNRDLLEAVWHLVNYRETPSSPPRRVNYAALDTEELGSVYESLLDYHPEIAATHTPPRFDLVSGSERKSTGSYYTPSELVAELVKSALEPVIEARLRDARTKQQKAEALLSIRVVDPAAGSGHFLLAVCRRLGKELAKIRTGEDEPAPERVREAVRDVTASCIYGVDKNPLAVELCRVALWLEAHTPGKPLTFLDHRIRCGDSLVGVFDLEVLQKGIPDDAFKPVSGDDREVAKGLRRQNRDERGGQEMLFGAFDAAEEAASLSDEARQVGCIPDDTPEAIRRKEALYQSFRAKTRRDRLACDLWTAAFFQPRDRSVPPAALITTDALRRSLESDAARPQAAAHAEALAQTHRFFHWALEFPEVYQDGGFDVVLCNPPYDVIRENRFLCYSPMHGTRNLFAHFISRGIDLLAPQGAAGFVVPLSLACGDKFEPARRKLYRNFGLLRASHYSIRPAKLFPGVEQRITLIRAQERGRQPCRVYSTRLHRWHRGEEHKVIANAEFGFVGTLSESSIPKVAGEIGASVYAKIRSQPLQILKWLARDRQDAVSVHYHSVARYWVKAYNFIPFFQREGEEPGVSTTLKTITLRDRSTAFKFLCLLNSSIFYYWWLTHSDEFHVLDSEILSFGIPGQNAPWPSDSHLELLVNNLMDSYRANAVRRRLRVRGGGIVHYDEFRPRRSLSEIYAIDDAIAPLYSLTSEEIEFLKTYDIHFRSDEE